MLNQIKRIVVVAGCQRSGTTLTGLILGSHRQAILLDETDGMYEWFAQGSDSEVVGGKTFRDLMATADAKYRAAQKRIAVFKDQRKLSPEIDTIILKAPNLTYSFEKLANLKQDVHIIYPIRDPRAVVSSMGKLDHIDMVGNQVKWIEKSDTIAKQFSNELEILKNEEIALHLRRALVWKIKSGLFEQFQASDLKTFTFNYESLISDKRNMCKSLAMHAGLPFDEKMLEHQIIYRGMAPGLTERTRPVDQNSVRKWKSMISGVQEKEILEIAGSLAESFGYGLGKLEEFDRQAPTFSRETFESPVILTGRGGSGTRLISEIAQKAGVFLGNRLNASQDSMEWVDIIYEYAIKKSVADNRKQPFSIENIGLFLDKVQDILEEGQWENDQPWGWKLPETMLVVPEMMNIFPKAKVVHLVRHPITSSFRRSHVTSRHNNPIGRSILTAAYNQAGRKLSFIKTDPDFRRNALTWQYQVKLVHDFAMTSMTAENYHLVRFEDLCFKPVQTTKNMVRFMGLPGHELLRPNLDTGRIPEIDLNDPAVSEVWDYCGELASELGYDELPEGIQNNIQAIAE